MECAVVAAFNQEKALVGAFSMIVQPVVEPIIRFAALVLSCALHSEGSAAALARCKQQIQFLWDPIS